MTTKPMIIILGLDEKQKPHAAKFDQSLAEAVRKAAGFMRFRTGIPKTDEAIALADRLPPGKLYAAGRGLVPFCKAESYQKLVDALEMEPEGVKEAPGPAKPATAPSKAPTGDPWADLKVGDKVIALESPNDGWWPAVVTAISKDANNLTLRWLDSKQPPVVRKRRAVALLSNG